MVMQRFQIIDCFGGVLRAFNTRQEAVRFKRLRKDCTIREVPISELLPECLF